MAWTTLPTFTSGNVLTSAQLNAIVANINESAPAKATGGGGFIVTTAPNQVTQRTPQSAEALAANSTTNTSFSFFTSGPAITITSGSIVWAYVTAMMGNDTVNQGCRMSVDTIGSHSPGDATALAVTSPTANAAFRATCLIRISGLTPGANTITAVYRAAASGTASFSQRRLDVLPLG